MKISQAGPSPCRRRAHRELTRKVWHLDILGSETWWRHQQLLPGGSFWDIWRQGQVGGPKAKLLCPPHWSQPCRGEKPPSQVRPIHIQKTIRVTLQDRKVLSGNTAFPCMKYIFAYTIICIKSSWHIQSALRHISDKRHQLVINHMIRGNICGLERAGGQGYSDSEW